MKRAFLVVLLLLLAGCSDDKDESTSMAPPSDPTKGTLSVVVVSDLIQPLSDAVVTVMPLGEEKQTNLFGRATFTGLEPGSYHVSTSLPSFDPDEVTAQVVAGEITKVRLVLTREAAATPRHTTHDLPGYFSASAGPAHDPATPHLEEAGYYDCVCDFPLTVPKATVALVIEAFWTDNYQPPQPAQMRWNLSWENKTLGGKGAHPMYAVVDTTLWDANFTNDPQEIMIHIRPDEVWPNTEQDFTLYVTVFEVAPPEEGWSVRPQ